MEHISKELALWLKERGCEIESGVCLLLDCNELCAQENLGDYKIGVDAMPTYSWYDILVTHAKEFWGEEKICQYCLNHEPVDWGDEVKGRKYCECDSWDWYYEPAFMPRTLQLLSCIQKGDFEKAEAYVREHSLFAHS